MLICFSDHRMILKFKENHLSLKSVDEISFIKASDETHWDTIYKHIYVCICIYTYIHTHLNN